MDKKEFLSQKTSGGILIFDKDSFPKFTDTAYDPILLSIINCGYIIKDKQDKFFEIIEKFLVSDDNKTFKFDFSDRKKIKDELIKDKILSGLGLFELNSNGNKHIDFLRELGAEIDENNIEIFGENAIKLKNQEKHLKEKEFDITFSNQLLDENSGIKYEKHTTVFSGLELYTLFSNITKKKGYSVHSNGSVISSLYDTFFQFIGLQVIDYFRHSDGKFDFTMVMKKINNKKSNFDEFLYIYNELKSRWPVRYGL